MLLRRNQTRKLTEDEVKEKLTNVVSVVIHVFVADELFEHTSLNQVIPSWILPWDKVTLLKYVQNKDVFMKYHKAHLTRRLILEMSNDQELEEQMVIMLKVSS